MRSWEVKSQYWFDCKCCAKKRNSVHLNLFKGGVFKYILVLQLLERPEKGNDFNMFTPVFVSS